MEKILKKALYTSVGFVTIATDKVQTTIKSLIDNGKISEEEGKKIVDDFMSDIDTKKGEVETRINGLMDKVVNSLDWAKRSEFSALKDRIKELEAQLENSETASSVKKVVKKAVAKKTTSTKK